MEKLKSAIPQTLKYSISRSNPDNLPSTCSSLHEFFLQLPYFHQMVKDLTDKETALFCKNKEAALESKRKGNQCFSNNDNSNALRFYTQALCVAPRDADDMGKNLVATLYVNRAAVLQRMGLLVECLRDCNRAVEISSGYAKAWYRRGKANTSLGNHEDAVCDFNVAMCMEYTLSGKRQIESELKLILGQRKGNHTSLDETNNNKSNFLDQQQQIQLQCISTATKGRGMVCLADIPQASLLHTEEPYAAIILKHCRETHCHFCLNELPADTVPCPSCSMSLYCSQLCQVQSGGQKLPIGPKNYDTQVDLSGDLDRYIANVTKASVSGPHIECNAEHRHECKGVNWPAVLPSNIVLAGRALVKSIEQQMHIVEGSSLIGNLELCHNYVQLGPESKLELHISSIILLCCLQHCDDPVFEMNAITISQCVILLSQIKVNSMAIVRMKSFDTIEPSSTSRKLPSAGDHSTNTVDQVRVGQAIYLAGSLFNHSCQPNIHSYFLSRTLHIRATDFVAAGRPLELSYGPQVGQWGCKDRQQSLEEQYSFICQCSGCSEINLSDLAINAFRCVKPNCSGVVLDSEVRFEKQKVNPFHVGPICSSSPHMQLKYDDIKRVASHLYEQLGASHQVEPGCCLNCGAYCDLEASNAEVNEAGIYIRRLEDALASVEVPTNILSDALRSLDLLKSALHPYNKKVAKVEDNLAQAFCLIGELKRASDHCKASIKILEKLYGLNHIVIGNELVKLASIQLSFGESAAVESISLMDVIFSRYYGSDVDIIFPHLQVLKREASKLIS